MNLYTQKSNIEKNNEILDLWTDVIIYKIRKNENISEILEYTQKGVVNFWEKYCEDINNGKIEIETYPAVIFVDDKDIPATYPLKKIVYLNQVAGVNKNNELSYFFINILIGLFLKTNNKSLENIVKSKIKQAINYNILYALFDDYFDIENIGAFTYYIFGKINDQLSLNQKISSVLEQTNVIVDIASKLITRYKYLLCSENWQRMLSDMGNHFPLTQIVLKYTNLKILEIFLNQKEYTLVYDYMNYYKNDEIDNGVSLNGTQYRMLPLYIEDWNVLLEEKWNTHKHYSLKSQYVDLFLLCRLKQHINEKIKNESDYKLGRKYKQEKNKNPDYEKLKLKFISPKETLDKFFNNDNILSPWRLSVKEKKYYKQQMLNDIESA